MVKYFNGGYCLKVVLNVVSGVNGALLSVFWSIRAMIPIHLKRPVNMGKTAIIDSASLNSEITSGSTASLLEGERKSRAQQSWRIRLTH